MRKKIFSLALGIIAGLIINDPIPSLLIGILFGVGSYAALLIFDQDEVEILEEHKREPEDPEEILP